MKMPDAYAEQARQSATDLPRQVLANLLERLLPRVPVARRPAEPTDPAASAPAPYVSSAAPSGTPLSRSRERPSKATMMRMSIRTTIKGSRKLQWLPETDNLYKITSAATVRQAVATGVSFGDVTYAWKTGYIDIITN